MSDVLTPERMAVFARDPAPLAVKCYSDARGYYMAFNTALVTKLVEDPAFWQPMIPRFED